MLDKQIKKKILSFQKTEITEYYIYQKLSRVIKDARNRDVLKRISDDELKHYNFWRRHTQEDVRPDWFRVWKYFLIAKILGLTFGIKLMEKGEVNAQVAYGAIAEFIPEALEVASDEDEHEKELLALIDEERLRYVGSIVLGLNDALVELTGALAGFTFALQNRGLIATAGLITGIAAALSMAASEYLSTKSEEEGKKPLKAAVYTGIAYIGTVFLLIFPFLLFRNLYFCLGLTIFNALLVIFLFTFYISVAKDITFRHRFLEMAVISLGVATLSFGIGFLVRHSLHIDI